MPTIRLINTSTRIRVDESLETSFFRTVQPRFARAVMSAGPGRPREFHEHHLDIHLVDDADPDLSRDGDWKEFEREVRRMPPMELLGVYLPHSSTRDNAFNHRRLVKVCPERILKTSLRLKKASELTLPLEDIYEILFHAVVIHELAHSLMDEGLHHACRWPTWKRQVELARKNEDHLKSKRDAADHLCDLFNRKALPPAIRNKKHWVEESLANAFIGVQRFTPEDKAVLKQFMSLQPAAYASGPQWVGNWSQLLATATSWKSFKSSEMGMGGRSWEGKPAAASDREDRLNRIVGLLKDPATRITSYDFASAKHHQDSDASCSFIRPKIPEALERWS